MINRQTIETDQPRSLCWNHDDLVDWVLGGTSYSQGTKKQGNSYFLAFNFDSAKMSADGEFVVVYKKLGTKGLILKNGELLREINRSYYHADTYEYPICILELAGKRKVLIHCPDEYCKLEIEDIETGEKVSGEELRNPQDIFHSRLESNGKYLLSAGWIWHPLDVACVYSIEEIMEDPSKLDSHGDGPQFGSEISSARFFGNSKMIVSSTPEEWDDEDENTLKPSSIGVYDLEKKEILKQVEIDFEFGNVVGINDDYALDLYKYPKIINLNTGKIEFKIEEIKTGLQKSSIIHHLNSVPIIAIHPNNRKVAIGTDSGIEILEITI